MRITLVVILVILFNGLFGWLHNQPQDAGLDVAQGKIVSLSYAPFREGQSPLQGVFPSAEEIDQDLRLLADRTHTIRTYASVESMGPIAKLAGKYGLQVTQGAWLGYDRKDNSKEIKALIKAANTYPQVIKRVIVGNEVLLREEMKPERLIEYIREVKKSVKQPVSYADVWSMYMKYPQLIKEVDFITIHILPYWEDEPIPVDVAPRHIERAYQAVKKEAESIAPGKSILIGESGWPSEGRQRGWAVPSVVNTARFIRGLIKVANENGFDYNIVEAFNQKWKSELEGIVGANWGLFSDQRKQLIPLTGTVVEDPDWYKRWLVATLALLIIVIIYRARYQKLVPRDLIILIVFMQLLLSLLVAAADYLWRTSYSDWQHLYAVFIIALNALTGSLVVQRAYQMLSGQADDETTGIQLYILYLLVVTLALYKTYGLAEWGRYLSFPAELAVIPVAGLLGLILIRYIIEDRFSWRALNINSLLGNPVINIMRDRLAGFALVFIGLAMIYGETRAFMLGRDLILAYPDFYQRLKLSVMFTLGNGQLLIWLACLAVLALPFLFTRQAEIRQ
jgi:exo-beta-1,3-glucanase (GH17 family)